MSERLDGGVAQVNPTSLHVFFGVDLLLFENTGSILFLQWSEHLNPHSPVATELHERSGGNNAE